jgi:hypothetical protein
MTTLTDTQLEVWREALKASQADDAAWTKLAKENVRRKVICTEMLELLKSYLTGQCETETFRDTFDRKTRSGWGEFGFGGMSGGMFLNKLVKHIPDESGLASQLRAVLRLPTGTDEGRARMRQFADYLDELIDTGKANKGQVQPARLPFLVSAWWHVQAPESWPVFYLSGRNALEQEGQFDPTGDPVEDYFAFRKGFLSIAQAIELNSWDCEHLLDWHEKQSDGNVPASPAAVIPDDGDDDPDSLEVLPEDDEAQPSPHTRVQWLLAKMGRKLGCKVWVAANDQSKEWNGEKLGDLCIDDLPTLGLDGESQKVIRLIDVVWIKGTHQVAAAFEIEHTTSIYSGLLRMADLVALSPNLNFPLYLVAPEHRLSKVRAQLSRPTFQILELHKRCGFFSTEALTKQAESIMLWATSPAVIEKLAAKVEDTKPG